MADCKEHPLTQKRSRNDGKEDSPNGRFEANESSQNDTNHGQDDDQSNAHKQKKNEKNGEADSEKRKDKDSEKQKIETGQELQDQPDELGRERKPGHGQAFQQGKDVPAATATGSSTQRLSYAEALTANKCQTLACNLRPVLPQSTKVDFFLFIPGDHAAQQAYINLGPDKTIPLQPVYEYPNLWRHSEILPGDPVKDHFKYKYGFLKKGQDVTVPILGFRIGMLSKDPSYCEECSEKRVEATVQFDVFHFSNDRAYRNDTLSQGVLFYLQCLLPWVYPGSINEILGQIETLHYTDLKKKHAKDCVNWIVDWALSYSVTDMQRLYLCIVLSHVTNVLPTAFSFLSEKKIVETCDRLLQCLNVCVHSNFLPKPCLKHLGKIAYILVVNSSAPGWLTLAAHFYPYLGNQFVLDQKQFKDLNYRYDNNEYKKMVATILFHMKTRCDGNQIARQNLLYLMLKNAPTVEDAFELFESPDVSHFFSNEDEKVDFFVKFYQETATSNTQKQSPGAKLVEFYKVPEVIRRKMHRFLLSTMLEYARSNDGLDGEESKLFVKTIILEKDLDMEEVVNLLTQLSKSKSLPRQKLLLQILNNDCFQQDWNGIRHEQKVDICKSWVVTRVANKTRNTSPIPGVDKIVGVYKVIDAIMQCSLNVSNKTLAQDVSSSVVDKFLRNEDAVSVLKAFTSVEKCADVIQGCYKSHVKMVFEQTPRAVRKSTICLKECSSSSLGKELLSCILDIVDVPEITKESAIDEDDFRKILDWCDLWVILLTTTGTVEKSKKYKAGKKICQHLETCLKNGDVSINFLLDTVDKEKENVSILCASVLNIRMPRSALADLQESILDQISKLVSLTRIGSEKIELLESAIKYGKKISNKVCPVNGIEDIIETFNGLKKNWRTKRVCELQVDAFWGSLNPFLSPAEALQPLVKSLSFMTVAKKGWKELNTHEDGDEAPAVGDFDSLMVFLTTKAIEELQAQWNPVLNDPGSLSFETMKTLLGTLKQNQLDVELELLANYFRRKFPRDVKTYSEDYASYNNVLEQVRHVIAILQIFGLADLSNETVTMLSQFETILENSNELTLESLHQSMEEAKKIVSSFAEENIDSVIKELSRSSELVSFIEKIVDEDIRFLIDAVEEHSDQFVSESSVSDLIDVHGFLAPLIKKKSQKKDPLNFLQMLKESCLGHEDIPVKIQQCSTNVNSLRGLYTSIANRGEITKEIISNCLSNGEYWVSQKDGKCEAKMSYVLQGSGEDKTCNYSLSDLHDLRSRAHLIVTSRKNAIKVPSSHNEESGEEIDFDDFINQVNLLTEISTLLSKLRSSGYFKYRQFWKRMKTTADLQKNKDSLQNDLSNWENIMKEARENHYFLNFYRSDQLCTLYDFLMNESNIDCDEVLSLIHFVDRTITKQQLLYYRESQKKSKGSNSRDAPEILLSKVGQALENIFHKSHGNLRLIPDDDQSQSYTKLEATVTPGEIFVVSLDSESPLTANVILTLYENTSNVFPEPYQIVFCSSQTTWEEIHLLLQRCFSHSKHLSQKMLFCIANVELLPNELQFRLVDAIKEKQKCYQSSEAIRENADYQLALICRGGDHHHVVEQFAQYSHHIPGMTDLVLSRRLKSSWPDVKMITSTLSGLGKTEQIKREVLEKSMNVATFSISGPFEPSKLVQRLKELKLTKYHCLHLDIGEVSDPLLLDMFLFQLIVTGMVSAGNQFYHLSTTHIYIEITNTLKDWLRESLVVSKYFNRIHLEWQNYKNLLVSTEITSNVQVVCQYLHILDRACIESKEVNFEGPKKSQPLPAHRCQELLAKYFSSDSDITFTTLQTFLGVLADQLLKFSKSTFFKIPNLKSMLGTEARGVRNNLFQALFNVSKEFASRAITTSRSNDGTRNLSQKESARALDKAMMSTAKSAKNMVERVKGMIQWEDSNHLLVVFHGLNSQAITAVYRTKTLVPLSVEKLLKSQYVKQDKKLEDFKTFTQEQLQAKLEKIACTKLVQKNNLFPSYALTPDNILKMVLIILRVRVNIPVIIMGETGCGKTSLVRYLANTCGVEFCTFNFHAGISEEEIITFIKKKESHAKKTKEQIWIFLDEINTCDHLGLISDIMCHHSLLGRPLSKYLVFLAACNPYKERPEEHTKTAGLEGKNITDEYSGLVYRVHPLPEAMIDYVWDYGSLAPKDERDYIARMVKGISKRYEIMLVELLAKSQRFIREAENNHFCVSLRDVHRCIRLISWFQKMMETRQELNTAKVDSPHLEDYSSMSKRYNKNPIIKSIVLALAHCYLSRLPTANLRKKYRECMMTVFTTQGTTMICDRNTDTFAAIIRMEEEDYLDRMELPPGTARNAALRENVFVMLVCILNRIPIFVVGKPGCSKSLSIQLIRSNLRGRDSQDPLFRKLPQLYVVSYQGSESSTSEGIIKVFEKARKYKSHNKDGNVLPVVLLDEVGLAENSKYNPLKVLHSLLEPEEGELSDVAVVGISNWSLDAAKMNRAIHLSRPEPTEEDLYETGHSLHYTDGGDDDSPGIGKNELRCLAEGYFEYQAQQTYANFHGLRDYYSLIKSLKGCNDFKEIDMSLQRNFGGLPGEVTNIQKIFLDKLKKLMISSAQDIIPVTQLIQANLSDPYARHLMLITNGDSAIGILKQSLAQLEKETITIFGSRFKEDLSEEYNYRILSRIILCMERDCILILRDLESIYGSLYDMLNQNYAVVSNRKNCRVALGAYSNPMCQVNDGFRCIVLIDQHKVDFSDPPFLNRFEKQVLRFSDVLKQDQQDVITELNRWVQGMSIIEGLESQFKETDMFIGFHEDTLPSLVLSHSHETDSSPEEVLKKCKDDLMWIASPDGVLRTQKCNLLKEDSKEVQEFSNEYFKKPLHEGFAAFMDHVVTNHQKSSFYASDDIGSKTIVMTFSNIHTDIRQCLRSDFKCQIERLSAYKSEKQLAEKINEFWNAPEKDLLVLQCKPDLDGTHLLLARSIIEEKRNRYKLCLSEMDPQGYKHVCIVVHVQRGESADGASWQFSFLCGWRQVFLDVLEAPPVPLNEILGESVRKLLTSSVWPIRRIAQNDLLWCFTCIKYTRRQRPVDTVIRIAGILFDSEDVSQVLEKLILQSIDLNALEQDQDSYCNDNWQVRVACDRQALVNSSTLYCAMEQFVSRLVRNPLAKIVYFLEKENAWPPHIVSDSNETSVPNLNDLWCKFIMNNGIFKISDIPEPLGAESYGLDTNSLDLCLPFSQVIHRKVDGVKELFLEDYATIVENENNLDDTGKLKHAVHQRQQERFSKMIMNLVPELRCFTPDCYDLYMKDIFDLLTSDFSPTLNRRQRTSVAQAMFISEVRQNFPASDMPQFCTLLHTFVWVHREQILDLLRMVDCCRPFIGLDVLVNVTNDMLQEEIMFVRSEEHGEVSGDESWETKETATNVTESENDAASNPHTEITTDELKTNETKLGDIQVELDETSQAAIGLQDNDEVIEEEIEHYEISERYGDILVTAYCEEMFPSQEIVERNGIEQWIRNANLLLSLAFKISEHSPAFHYLRLCVDFSRIIFISNGLPTNLPSLYILNDIGKTLRPEYLDHQESFEAITNELMKPLEENMKNYADKEEALQKFSALFYGRCIDTNVDTSAVCPIVEQVFSLERPELVMMMSPVMLRLLMVEEMQTPGIFMDLITNPTVMEKCPCLQNIDEVFKDHFSKGLIHHDSYPSVMMCDLIQCLLHFEDQFNIDDIDSSDCRVLTLARSATILVSQNSEDGCGISVISAVAFLRGFFTMLAQYFAAHPSALKEDSPYAHVITEVNSLLKEPESSLQVFFIKQLHENASLFDLYKLLGENNALPLVHELWHSEKNQLNKARFTSVFKYPEYDEAKAAYWRLMKKEDSSMKEFVTKCKSSPKHAFALLGILTNMVYLKRGVRGLTDKEEQLVDWFNERIASFPVLFKALFSRIIGRENFECSQLQLSPQSSVNDVEMALLILHIACVVATSALAENLPLYRYFTNPIKFKQLCVLAHCEEDIRSVFEDLPLVKESVFVTCPCGFRLAFKCDSDKKVCPHCSEVQNNGKKNRTEASATLFSADHKIPECDRCTKCMNPAVYHALRVIVNSSYYAGIALGTSTEEKLSTALNLLCKFEVDSDSADAAKFCYEKIENDLSCLMKILNCKRNVAIKTMHLVVEKSSDLIRSNFLLGANNCSTPKMREEWEALFSKLTETACLQSCNISKEIKEMQKLNQTEDNQDTTLECRILELDNYSEEPEEQNQQLKRLFRLTKQPCFDDFRSAFLYSPKDVQEKHTFLTLFFARFDQLQIIGHLHHLLKWSRLVSSALTHRISRKDAQSKSINDFISGHLLELTRTPQETETLNALFNNFRDAWNEIRLLVNEVLLDNKEGMPRLRETDYVAYCLTESDFGIYLQKAIEILVSRQNTILDAIISLPSHPALSFLEKTNCSGVMCASIQDVKEKEIISFQWSDDLFQHAQNNPEYGKGQEITYDFERIEMELAAEIAFGKCYLTGKLNKFVFAKELFHSCGPLLTEIRSLVKQSPSLPEEVRKDLPNVKERRIKEAQDLLQHMEVLIYLLKRKLKNFNVDMTLEELAEEWAPMLPSPFPVKSLPQPRSLIKIKHVAALYEALEDLLADGAIEGLDDKFRTELPSDVKETLRVMVDKENDQSKENNQLKPHNLLKALRRFVFRYLSSETERYWPDQSTALQSYLKDESLWSPNQPPNLNEFPQDIALKHIHSIVRFLEEVTKERKGNGRRPGLRSSSRQHQTINQVSGRRRLQKFSRT